MEIICKMLYANIKHHTPYFIIVRSKTNDHCRNTYNAICCCVESNEKFKSEVFFHILYLLYTNCVWLTAASSEMLENACLAPDALLRLPAETADDPRWQVSHRDTVLSYAMSSTGVNM